MKNLLRAEFYYLSKSKRFYIFIGLIALVNIVALIIHNDKIITLSEFLAFIFSALIILEFSHKDFNQKTMKNYVGGGLNLFKVYIGKLIVCITAVFILLATLTITETIAQQVIGVSNLNIAGVVLSLFINLLKCVVVFAICSLISSGAASIIVSLAYIIGIPIASAFIHEPWMNAINPFLLDNLQNAVKFLGSVLPQDSSVVQALITNGSVNAGIVAWHLAVTFVIVVLLALLGAFVYSKREVK